ncbi:hypothetical protein TEA_006558 [Camellia sinensis var. sinensis]|uniref:Rab-GAP TBC domain-containing protein n=1 Tax=Camellia sinensis var. sinensis TaxID=542762 RepID=A0A4S4E1N8_CAMSN|nr:hypothetical protein TEA_006558 [Camellia sinensis var. sinensis]
MDQLINSKEDVSQLRRHEVLDHWLGDDEKVALMFNSLGTGVFVSEQFYYVEQRRKVNAHCKRWWNRLVASLKRDYFTNIWVTVATFAAEKMRELAWSGVPSYLRPTVWRLLLGYAPPNSDRREGVLRRKRVEYLDCVAQYYDVPDTERTDEEVTMLRQIAVDCPRTVPDVSFFQQAEVQKSLERILYTWAIRHPASGYVQGINDLATPFLVVFLSEYLEGSVDNWSISDLPLEKISNIEADCYWCLSKLLDGMQDHYTFAQPGIQRLVFKLKELVRRIDEPVSRHMEEQGLEFLQFAFRWFNCLLIREIPFNLVTRLWDTYLAEGDALPDFLVYIFASFLLTWSDKLQKLDFQEMVMFLQHLPTQNWTHLELEMVLSRAYMWHTMFNSSPSHLAS